MDRWDMLSIPQWRWPVMVLAMVLLACAPATARRPAGTVPGAVPAHQAFQIPSRSLAEARLINVYVPTGREATALPVLYMPDGGIDEDFPHVVATVDSLIAAGAIRPVIVVGIPNTERRRDLTGPTRVASDSAVAPRVGGSAAFRSFIRHELIPEVERRYRTTPERAIIGESFAGLFVLETFLHDPTLFQHYIALDPSLWWDAGGLVAGAAGRVASPAATERSLYLASSREPSTATGSAALAALLPKDGSGNLRWTYVPRTDLEHATIFRALKTEALVSALR